MYWPVAILDLARIGVSLPVRLGIEAGAGQYVPSMLHDGVSIRGVS